MAKDKDKTLNPAAAHLKSQKASALKKSKAQVAQQRAERLSTRNPEKLQRRIDELKAVSDAQSGVLGGREKQELEKLERDVKAIWKARGEEGGGGRGRGESGGRGRGGHDGGDGRGRGRGRGGAPILGKRRREFEHEHEQRSESPETDPEVRDIPMPRDTPPPIPPRHFRGRDNGRDNPNLIDLPSGGRIPHALPAKPAPAAPAQTTYSSAPQIRDLRKEATAKFVPAAVASKLKKVPGGAGVTGGEGILLEPEEMDALEKAGYMGRKPPAIVSAEDEEEEQEEEDEEARFERELKELEQQHSQEDNFEDATDARHRLKSEARKDIVNAVNAAEQEVEYHMMADAAVLEDVSNPAEQAEQVEFELRRVEEEDHPGALGGDVGRSQAAKKLRLVEIEDVDDDEW